MVTIYAKCVNLPPTPNYAAGGDVEVRLEAHHVAYYARMEAATFQLEARMWRRIARALERHRNTELRGTGLCFLTRLYGSTENVRIRGCMRIVRHLGRRMWHSPPGKDWDSRCLAAYWMEREALEDAETIHRAVKLMEN